MLDQVASLIIYFLFLLTSFKIEGKWDIIAMIGIMKLSLQLQTLQLNITNGLIQTVITERTKLTLKRPLLDMIIIKRADNLETNIAALGAGNGNLLLQPKILEYVATMERGAFLMAFLHCVGWILDCNSADMKKDK